MPVPVQTPYIEYTGNGSTTSFPLTFDCEKAEFLMVTINGTAAVVGSWSLAGGNVVFTTPPAVAALVVFKRSTPNVRTANYNQYDNSFRPLPVNKDFDKIWIRLQELGVEDWLLWRGLNAEIAARILADEIERLARIAADNLEIAARKAADVALQAYLVDKINGVYASLSNSIVTEANNRIAGDNATALSAREYIDFMLRMNISMPVFDGVTDNIVMLPDGSTQRAANTFQKQKNQESISILDLIPPTEHPLILNKTSTYDCMPALAACIATGKRVIVPMPGKYVFKAAYNGTTNFDVEATAPDVTFDFSQASLTTVITNSGSLTQVANLSENIERGKSSLVLASASNLSVGDWICIYNPTDGSYSNWRNYYRAGEFKQILKIVGTTITTTQPFYDSYAAGAVGVYRLNSVKCRLANVRLDGGTTNPHLVCFGLSSQASFENVTFTTSYQSALWLDRCVQARVVNAVGFNYGRVDGTTDYGLLVGNCQHLRVIGGDIYGRRHALGVGGGDKVCGVPVRDMRVMAATLRNDPISIVGAGDMHGNIEDSSYEDCIIYGGCNLGGGGENFYKRCTIHSDQTSGRIAYLREVKGGKFGLYDCKCYCYNNPQASLHGVFDVGGNTDVLTANTVSDFELVLHNIEVNSTSFGSLTQLVLVTNRGSSVKVNIDIDNIKLNVNDLFEVLRMGSSSGTANSDRIIVDHISGKMPTSAMIFHVSNAYLAFPHRVQRQSGVVTLTTIAQNVTTAPTQPYRFKYPRVPVSQVTLRGKDGGSSNYGGQLPLVHAFSVTTTSIRPQIKSAVVFTAGDDFDLTWEVGLNEC